MKPWLSGRFFRLAVVVVSLILVVSLSQSVYWLWHRKDIIREREDALKKVEADNQRLKQALEEAQSPTFIERQAREKLGLVREGEAIVLLPPPPAASEGSQPPEGAVSNWTRWWNLFF